MKQHTVNQDNRETCFKKCSPDEAEKLK